MEARSFFIRGAVVFRVPINERARTHVARTGTSCCDRAARVDSEALHPERIRRVSAAQHLHASVLAWRRIVALGVASCDLSGAGQAPL